MVNNIDIVNALGIKSVSECSFETLGLVNSEFKKTITFCDTEKFMNDVNENKNLSGIFINSELKKNLKREDLTVFVVEDPRFSFYTLQNYLYDKNYTRVKTIIGNKSVIHKTAYVSDNNVMIGNNVMIEPNVTILEDVEIGNNVIIRAGTVVGAEGFEHKKTSKGLLAVKHNGKVIIEDNVQIGANNAISKGFSYRNTIIGEDTRTDNLVHIAHGVQIGKRCLFPASCMIAGTVTIEDDVWIGPNASISSQITIGKNAYITIGAVVTRNISENQTVSGNFAIDHNKFIQFIKTIR